MDKDGRIQRFFELCKSSSFPHREELLRGIETDEYSLKKYSSSEVPSKQMLDIYKVRERLLGRKRSKHAQRLRNEVLMYINELEQAPNDKVNFWLFSINDSSQYIVFEGVNSQKVLGCLLIVSKTKVSESEWKKLWGKE